MRTTRFLSLIAVIFGFPGIALGATAQEILDKARAKQLERWKGVNCYAVVKSVMGHQVTTYHERVEVVLDDGSTETVFVARPDMCELQGGGRADAGTGGQPRKLTPEEMEAFAQGLDMTGGAMSGEMNKGMEQAGLPPGLLKGMGNPAEPWASPDPATMLGSGAAFMRAGTQGQREMAAERQQTTMNQAREMAELRKTARLVGTETVDGRKAYHLRASGSGQVQNVDGQEFTMQEVNIWLDTRHLVPLKTTMSGTLRQGAEERPVEMEHLSLDYREVPGSRMYESYRQKMNIGGLMSEEQKAQMAAAEKQMAEAEAQLAAMPPEQRAMVESMMGGQMDMIRNMSSGGGFGTETVVTEIRINPTGGAQASAPTMMPGTATGFVPDPASAPAAAPAAGGDAVLRMVQENLAALGYATGNTDGIPSTETTIAISQFQAEQGMEVTGQASPQLAGILAAEVGKRQGDGYAPASARTPEQLQAAREACLQEKIEAAQASQKKKRGFGRLMSAATRVAGRTGNYDLARTTSDIYTAGATADDLAAAAEDLGITQSDIEACENP